MDFSFEKNKVRIKGKICKVPAGPNIGLRVMYAADMDDNTIEFIEEL